MFFFHFDIPKPSQFLLCFGRDEDEALEFAWTRLNLGQVAETEKCILNDEGLMLLCGAKAGEI